MLHIVVHVLSNQWDRLKETAIPITLAGKTYMYMRVVAVLACIWPPLPSEKPRSNFTLMDDVLNPLLAILSC
jgi:hypothetical protein